MPELLPFEVGICRNANFHILGEKRESKEVLDFRKVGMVMVTIIHFIIETPKRHSSLRENASFDV